MAEPSARPFARRVPRWARAVGGVVLFVVLALVADAIVLNARIETWDVALPAKDDGVDTWVLVGTDSRAHVPAGSDVDAFGTTDQVDGERADLIIIVTLTDNGAHAVSVPRDLLVMEGAYPKRLGLVLDTGPQAFVDSMCTSLGVPVDHLVGLRFDGFVRIVDALGGVEVNLEYPLRDPLSGLDLPDAGTQRLDGAQALALIRSRHSEQLINGTWTPTSTGIDDRARWGGTVLAALMSELGNAWGNPITMQKVAWHATGALRADADTSLFDFADLAEARGVSVSELPHDEGTTEASEGNAVPLPVTQATFDTLATMGLSGTCESAG